MIADKIFRTSPYMSDPPVTEQLWARFSTKKQTDHVRLVNFKKGVMQSMSLDTALRMYSKTHSETLTHAEFEKKYNVPVFWKATRVLIRKNGVVQGIVTMKPPEPLADQASQPTASSQVGELREVGASDSTQGSRLGQIKDRYARKLEIINQENKRWAEKRREILKLKAEQAREEKAYKKMIVEEVGEWKYKQELNLLKRKFEEREGDKLLQVEGSKKHRETKEGKHEQEGLPTLPEDTAMDIEATQKLPDDFFEATQIPPSAFQDTDEEMMEATQLPPSQSTEIPMTGSSPQQGEIKVYCFEERLSPQQIQLVKNEKEITSELIEKLYLRMKERAGKDNKPMNYDTDRCNFCGAPEIPGVRELHSLPRPIEPCCDKSHRILPVMRDTRHLRSAQYQPYDTWCHFSYDYPL